MIALFTTMPVSMMMPSSDMMLTLTPVAASRGKTPTAASGSVNMMMKGCTSDSNCAAITM
ncbi:MAG: hypothetical protein QN162_07815 [Armatimonadota bacterium]|nr:hypothetical protein [Armatimonadota bacterium]